MWYSNRPKIFQQGKTISGGAKKPLEFVYVTTTIWTRWPSGTLQMSPLKVPNIFLLRQKFKIDLVFLVTCFSLSVREKSMQTMLQKYIFVIFVTKRCLQSLRIQLLNFTQKKVIKRRLIEIMYTFSKGVFFRKLVKIPANSLLRDLQNPSVISHFEHFDQSSWYYKQMNILFRSSYWSGDHYGMGRMGQRKRLKHLFLLNVWKIKHDF